MEGNNEADRLVDLGQLSSPLIPVLHSPIKAFVNDTLCTPPPPAPAKRAHLSMDFSSFRSQTVCQFNFSSPACGRVASITALSNMDELSDVSGHSAGSDSTTNSDNDKRQ